MLLITVHHPRHAEVILVIPSLVCTWKCLTANIASTEIPKLLTRFFPDYPWETCGDRMTDEQAEELYTLALTQLPPNRLLEFYQYFSIILVSCEQWLSRLAAIHKDHLDSLRQGDYERMGVTIDQFYELTHYKRLEELYARKVLLEKRARGHVKAIEEKWGNDWDDELEDMLPPELSEGFLFKFRNLVLGPARGMSSGEVAALLHPIIKARKLKPRTLKDNFLLTCDITTLKLQLEGATPARRTRSPTPATSRDPDQPETTQNPPPPSVAAKGRARTQVLQSRPTRKRPAPSAPPKPHKRPQKRIRARKRVVQPTWVISPPEPVTRDFLMGGIGEVIRKTQDAGLEVEEADANTLGTVVSAIVTRASLGEGDLDQEVLLRNLKLLMNVFQQKLNFREEECEVLDGKLSLSYKLQSSDAFNR